MGSKGYNYSEPENSVSFFLNTGRQTRNDYADSSDHVAVLCRDWSGE